MEDNGDQYPVTKKHQWRKPQEGKRFQREETDKGRAKGDARGNEKRPANSIAVPVDGDSRYLLNQQEGEKRHFHRNGSKAQKKKVFRLEREESTT